MGSLSTILEQLDERYIAKNIGIPHDGARGSYRLATNTVPDIDMFRQIIGDYYNYHFTTCVSHGGSLSATEAQGRAKEIIESNYRNHGSDFVGAFNDAHDGTNGGLRIILDKIAQQLKEEAIERHIRKVFDDEVKPNSWEDKVDIIRQFISRCGQDVFQQVDVSKPERYASNWTELIRAYIDSLRKTSSLFRRL
jgi:hypothetical protein